MKKNKLLTKSLVFILTLTLLLSSCIPAFAAWKKVNNNWYYLTADGKAVTGWQKINGEWYHFDKNGVRDTGWKYVSNGWYNFGTDGIRKTGWQKINGEWYHFDQNGIRDTGWKYVCNGWYYFGTDGIRKTGWQKINGEWYHFDQNGIRDTGWKYVYNGWYYFGTDGIRKTGWQKINGEWYHFDKNGIRDTGWKYVYNGWYYFGTDGIRQTGWQDIDGKRYFLDDNGIRQTGFLYHTYYLQEDGSMAIGWTEIDGELYCFDDNGVMYRHKWIDDKYINYEGKLTKETEISFDKEIVKVDISYWEGVPSNAVKVSCEDADLIHQLTSQFAGLEASHREYEPMAGGSAYDITLYYADGSSEQCYVLRDEGFLNYNDVLYDIDIKQIDDSYINCGGKLKDETAISFDKEIVRVDISYWEGVPSNAVKASCEDADIIHQLISQIEGLEPSQRKYEPIAGGSVYNITLNYADGSSEHCDVIREQDFLKYNDIWYDIDVNGIDTVWEKISN